MEKIKINVYSELEKIKELGENEFIIDLEDCAPRQRIRIVDFFKGLTFLNGSMKKLNKNEFAIMINRENKNNLGNERKELENNKRPEIKHVFAKNKTVVTALRSVKENVINNILPTNNPISLNGLDKPNRYQFFFRMFSKEFNSVYKGQYRYLSCEEIDVEKVKDKKFVIIENIDLLNENLELQERILEVMDYCLNEKIQVILCSNNVENLEVNEKLKSKLTNGLILYIED